MFNLLHNITYQKHLCPKIVSLSLILAGTIPVSAKTLWQGEGYAQLTAEQKSLVEIFTAKTLALLPPDLQKMAQDKVILEFKDFNQTQTFALPQCTDLLEVENRLLEKIRHSFEGKEESSLPSKLSAERGSIYGKTEKEFLRARYHVQLNKQFIQILLQGPESSAQYPCGHHTAYRLAQASLLHEISHVYDDENAPASQDPSEKRLRAECAERERISGFNQLPLICRELKSATHSVSDRPLWKNILNWHAGFFDNKPRNILSIRSPDAYEWANLKEAFAVNMEYFLLDPSYSCRRPEIADFLRNHFHFRSAETPSCKLNTLVYYSSRQNQLDLNWQRLYQIHYLLAAKGNASDSSFGHAMLRLVYCAPTRTQVGPECLKDQAYHVVISFRASIDGIVTDKIKGILGQYPSQMFIYPLSQIISEYTVSQFRDLTSIPIRFSEVEKERFVQRVLQYYWEYQGRYYFFTNNCATEAMNFIKGSIFRSDLQAASTFLETPFSLYRQLRDKKLLDESFFENPANKAALEGRYIYSSYGKVIDKTLKQLGTAFKNPKDIYELADQFSAEQRRALFAQASAKMESKAKIKDLAILFYRLERAIGFVLDEDKQYQLNKAIAEDRSSKYLSDIRDIVLARSRLTPWLLAENSYGIPLKTEMRPHEYVTQVYVDISKLSKSLEDTMTKDFPEMIDENQKVNANLLYFYEQINKNVELPKSP